MAIISGKKYRRVTRLSWLCIGVLVGLLLAKYHFLRWNVAWALAGLVLCTKWRTMWPGVVAWCVIGLVIGCWRGNVVYDQLTEWGHLYFRQQQLIGTISEDPAYGAKHRQNIYVGNITQHSRALRGTVRVHTLGSASVHRGDTVQISGKLYPGFSSYQATMPFAALKVVAVTHNPLEIARRHFFTGVYNVIPDPEASLGLGFLVGLKTQLPADIATELQALALTHIVVASGYNLTIVVRLCRRILARYSKFQALVGSMTLMTTMVVITGFSASMVRAVVVSSLALFTWYFGRQVHAALLIMGSAAITAWYNPIYLWHDLGWWLSFMAFMGVLILSPLLQQRFVSRAPPRLLNQVLLETISAELLVEPLIMIVFGQFSVLGLMSNIVVVPLIPLAMACTCIAGIAGMFTPFWAGWIAVPARLLLTYIVNIIQWLAAIPWAFAKLHLPVAGLAAIYGTVGLLAILLYKRTRFKYYKQASVID